MEENKNEAFKVVDKRRFLDPDVPSQDSNPKFESSPPTSEPNNQPKTSDDKGHTKETSEVTFSSFVNFMAHQTMMGLGLTPWMDSGLIKKDLKLAKETLDILNMLKNKTINNLESEEENFLNTVLYQLQMAYVKETSPLTDTSSDILVK